MTRTTIAIANAAGSAGKSTTTTSLAALIAEQGRRVLVVDADAQGTATQWLGHDPDTVTTTLNEIMFRRAPLADAILDTSAPGVGLIPANADLNGAAVQMLTVPGSQQRLAAALKAVPTEYEVVLIDCPGTLSVLTVSALVAADHVITVFFPTMKEIRGVPALQDAVADVNAYLNDQVDLIGIVPCRVPASNRGRVYADAMNLLAEAYPDLVTPPIRDSKSIPEAHAQGVPLPIHAPRERVTRDYRDVLAWLQRRGVLS